MCLPKVAVGGSDYSVSNAFQTMLKQKITNNEGGANTLTAGEIESLKKVAKSDEENTIVSLLEESSKNDTLDIDLDGTQASTHEPVTVKFEGKLPEKKEPENKPNTGETVKTAKDNMGNILNTINDGKEKPKTEQPKEDNTEQPKEENTEGNTETKKKPGASPVRQKATFSFAAGANTDGADNVVGAAATFTGKGGKTSAGVVVTNNQTTGKTDATVLVSTGTNGNQTAANLLTGSFKKN